MMLQGETVTIIRMVGGGVDDDGYPLPSREERTDVAGCVIGQRSAAITSEKDRVLVEQGITFTMPGSHDFDDPNGTLFFIARGEEWRPDGEKFEHASAFGTHLLWTEIPVEKVRVA